MSFNNVGHLITSTITTLQHFATLYHTNQTTLHYTYRHKNYRRSDRDLYRAVSEYNSDTLPFHLNQPSLFFQYLILYLPRVGSRDSSVTIVTTVWARVFGVRTLSVTRDFSPKPSKLALCPYQPHF